MTWCKVSRKYIDAFLSYSAKTKRDGRTDGHTDIQTDRQTDGGRCNISRPVPSAGGNSGARADENHGC